MNKILRLLLERTLGFFRKKCARIYELLKYCLPRVSLLRNFRDSPLITIHWTRYPGTVPHIDFDKPRFNCYDMSMLRRFFSSLADIVYPRACLVCKKQLKGRGDIDNLVCLVCWGKIKRNPPPFCYRCGRHLEKATKNICPDCVRKELHFDRAFSPCVYEGVIKELIHTFKYQSKDYLGATLSRLMVKFIEDYDVPVDLLDLIIPIPLHRTRLREREFNQAGILSNHIARRFNKKVMYQNLKRLRNTRRQTELETQERILNVKDSFAVIKGQDIKGKNILLIDDVLTTGATSSEAAYALKNSGANIVFVLTLAN